MSENEKTIGETIREHRLRKGYTQDSLAAEMMRSAISKRKLKSRSDNFAIRSSGMTPAIR